MAKRVFTKPEAAAVSAATDALALHQVRPADSADPELHALARKAGSTVAIQVKHLPTMRREDLVGRLAHGVITLRARTRAETKTRPLLVVIAPHLSESSVGAAREFMNAHGRGVEWMLVGTNGDIAVSAPALGVEETKLKRRRDPQAALSASSARLVREPFSDLNSFMLKVLLLRDVEARFWGGPRGPTASAAQLASVAGVSEPHAYRFVKAFEQMDFLRRTDEGLVVVRRAALLDSWLEAVRLRPRSALPVRSRRGRPKSMQELFRRAQRRKLGAAGGDSEVRVALAGFDACRALRVLHTDPGLSHVHVAGDVADVLDAYDLERCPLADSHVILLPTKSVSVFRGATALDDGLLCVDILQAALDVVLQPARGLEQAEFIVHDVLGARGSR